MIIKHWYLTLHIAFSLSSVSRADELETALMEMVKQDNRRELSAKVNANNIL